MKRLIGVMLATLFAFGLCACGGTPEASSTQNNVTAVNLHDAAIDWVASTFREQINQDIYPDDYAGSYLGEKIHIILTDNRNLEAYRVQLEEIGITDL